MTAADVRDRLRQLTEAHAGATPGPWAQHPADPNYVLGEVSDDGESYLDVADTINGGPGDATAIVASVNAVPWLVAALTAVLDLADDYDDGSEWGSALYHGHAVREQIRAVVAAAGDQP